MVDPYNFGRVLRFPHVRCIRREMALSTSAAQQGRVSVQSPHLRVVAKHRVTFNTPDDMLLDLPPSLRFALQPIARRASVEGGVEDTTHLCHVVSALLNIWLSV